MQGSMCRLWMHVPFMDAYVVYVHIIYGSMRHVWRYNVVMQCHLWMHVPFMDPCAVQECMCRFYIVYGCMYNIYIHIHA